jgi:hypothetical protein
MREAIRLNRDLTALLAEERALLGGIEGARYIALVSRRQAIEKRIDAVHSEVSELLFQYAGIPGFECLRRYEIQDLLDELRGSMQETVAAVRETAEATRRERSIVARHMDETGKRGKQAVWAYRHA